MSKFRAVAHPGLTAMLTVGKFAGFYLHIGKRSWRVCLGWVAISVYCRDLDGVLWAWSCATLKAAGKPYDADLEVPDAHDAE